MQETTYHVLWELVHVFFEHPGLLSETCITCGDVAVPARVVALENGVATIEKDGLHEEVAVDLIDHTPQLGTLASITSLGQDASGELYVVAQGGSVYRLAPAVP